MCGFYGHGFWWETEQSRIPQFDYISVDGGLNRLEKDIVLNQEVEHEVLFNFEINSHYKIQEDFMENPDEQNIPSHAHRCGFNPLNGKGVTNESLELPDKVKEKIQVLFEAYFPDKESIADWMICNYAENHDKVEWDIGMIRMLGDEGYGLFHRDFVKSLIESIEASVRNFQMHIRNLHQRLQMYDRDNHSLRIDANGVRHRQYHSETLRVQQAIKQHNDLKIDMEQTLEALEARLEYYVGSMKDMDLQKYVEYFKQHPNDFWAGRTAKREVEYKKCVTV